MTRPTTITVDLSTTNSVIEPAFGTASIVELVRLLATGTNPPVPVPNLGRQGYLDYITGRYRR